MFWVMLGDVFAILVMFLVILMIFLYGKHPINYRY